MIRRAEVLSIGCVGALMLSGCASIKAMQRPVSLKDIAIGAYVCPSAADIADQSTAGSEGTYRDRIILKCIKAIDRNYAAFKVSLHQESTDANLTADILALGLTGGASVAGKATAQGLSAAAAFVIGTNKAISKDVFYDMTLPAIESSMDARRAKVLAGIVDAQVGDPSGLRYTLERAGYDLDAYEAAGNIYAAIAELTRAASDNATMGQKAVADSQQGLVKPLPVALLVTKDVNARVTALLGSVQELTDPAGTSKLAAIDAALGITPAAAENFNTRRANVKVEIARQVSDPDAAKQLLAITNLEQKLGPILRN